jgi:hypothetical protein
MLAKEARYHLSHSGCHHFTYFCWNLNFHPSACFEFPFVFLVS